MSMRYIQTKKPKGGNSPPLAQPADSRHDRLNDRHDGMQSTAYHLASAIEYVPIQSAREEERKHDEGLEKNGSDRVLRGNRIPRGNVDMGNSDGNYIQ